MDEQNPQELAAHLEASRPGVLLKSVIAFGELTILVDLANLLDDYRQSLAKAIGAEGADVLVARARALLS